MAKTLIENLFVAIRADSKGLDSDLKGVLGKFKKLENVGKNLSLKLSLPIVALSGVVLKMAGDFESAMNSVAAIRALSVRGFLIVNMVSFMSRSVVLSCFRAGFGFQRAPFRRWFRC